jgi:hypothetical protein
LHEFPPEIKSSVSSEVFKAHKFIIELLVHVCLQGIHAVAELQILLIFLLQNAVHVYSAAENEKFILEGRFAMLALHQLEIRLEFVF